MATVRQSLPPKARLSLGAGVAIGFVVLLVLMSVLTWLALARVAALNQEVTELVEVNNLKVALATRMKNALRERALIMHTMSVMTDPFRQDEEFLRFQDLGADFTSARTQLEFIASGDEETAILARMRELTFSTQPIVVEAINFALKQQRPAARQLIDLEIIPRQKKLSAEIDALVDLQQHSARESAQTARSLASDTRFLMLVLGGFALIVGMGVAGMVWRRAHRQQQLLEHQALYDNLTELPNRRLFVDRLDQAILSAVRERRAFGVLLLDLNRFKEVNDTFGHHAGDAVLSETAIRVRACLRAADTVARLGGDEMAILLPNTVTAEAVQAMAVRLLEQLRQPYRIEGHNVELGGSIGIAMYPEHGSDSESLQRHADAAMYHAKRQGSGYTLYQPDMDSRSEKSISLQAELRMAIEQEALEVYYQPKIDLVSNGVQGLEALVRWTHPIRGLLLPKDFLPTAERGGLMPSITRLVLKKAMLQSRAWRAEGVALPISVNITPACIQDATFPDQVQRLLQEVGATPGWLEIEMTEAAVVSNPLLTADSARRLTEMGIQVSIDDFGTGYASVLKLNPNLLAKIKIDRPYVRDIIENEATGKIIRSTIDLGHNLGLKVVAEGVENDAVLNMLRDCGCDQVQGHVHTAPLPADQLTEWLRHFAESRRPVPTMVLVSGGKTPGAS